MNNPVSVLVMDVDGTLTDGKIYIGNQGEVMKAFHVRDGYGIRHLLKPAGIIPVVITGRQSEIVRARCREIGVEHLYQGVQDKLQKINELSRKMKFDLSRFAFIGDDLNDLSCMMEISRHGGMTGCPADAVIKVREASGFVSSMKGGEGAVREFIEWLTEDPECQKKA